MYTNVSQDIMKKLLKDQQDEITAYSLYKRVSESIKDSHNSRIIKNVSIDEMSHYNRIKEVTGRELKPQKLKILFLFCMIKLFGITFGIKLFEKSESKAIKAYGILSKELAFMDKIVEEEKRHEEELINMIDEERLNYMGSVVLGLNDALVELTGALAGYTFAFQETRLIALTGLITGISASLSMAASEYLSTRHEGGNNAFKSSVYTGTTYVITVVFLILPFIMISNPFISLFTTLVIAVFIIFAFNYYISVAKDYDFKKRFIEMAIISLGVATISFGIGVLVKKFISLDL